MSGTESPCLAKLERLCGQVEVIRRKIDGLARIVADGAEVEYPWYRLKSPARRKAVEAVLNCLREHRSYTVRQAASKVFVLTQGGYPNWEALAAYCYSVDVPMFV